MPAVSWTEAEKKDFQRQARAAVWTLLIIVALLFLFGIVTPPTWLQPWLFVVYAAALWVPVYKLVRARWGKA